MARVFQTLGELGDHLETTSSSVPGAWVVDPPMSLMEAANSYTVWATQPSVRKVVDFIARNIASISVHQFERVSDTERRRVSTGPVADLLRDPSTAPLETAYRFWHSVLVDRLIYDKWMALTVTDAGAIKLQRVPGRRFRFETDALDRIVGATVWGQGGQTQDVRLDQLIGDAGYSVRGGNGTSPMQTLKDVLSEASESVKYRRDIMARGARVPAYISRPTPWPADGKARKRFEEQWRAFESGGGRAGGTPLLEDGMELRAVDSFKPVDVEVIEGRKLTDAEVASAYHIAPELVGAREGNFASIDAFRQMLYGSSLGPYIIEWEAVLNLAFGDESTYLEANIDAKLRGSFLEQAAVTSSAVGAPWMTRDEARSMRNLPPVPGGDQLVTPLNVLIGGQTSPRDSGTQNEKPKSALTGARHHRGYLGKPAKAAPSADQTERATQVVAAFFDRQGRSVLSAIGSDPADYWDTERWDDELSTDLLAISHTLADIAGTAAATDLGYPKGYDPDLTVNYLATVANDRAAGINETTRLQVAAALADDDADPAKVFEAEGAAARAAVVGLAVATFAASFGTVEAAKQIRDTEGVSPTKTWVTGANPRAEHAAMDGETAPIDAAFSNGMQWPGQGGTDDAGCNCSVDIEL